MANALMISVHDFRSLRKASVHFITAEMVKRGTTRFFSVGLSSLSQRRGDTRASFADKAGLVEQHEQVACYLWRTFWHPFNMRKFILAPIEAALFRGYRMMIPQIPRKWIAEADIVFIESGLAVIFIGDVRRINPSARIIYLASDDLDVVECAGSIRRSFRRNYDKIDTVRLPSRFLADGMPHTRNVILAPHGIDRSIAEELYPDPYDGQKACISVGSMLFDPTFFTVAAAQFPELQFHIIGAGKTDVATLILPNIIIHPEMAFAATLPYLQHAVFGIAPYRDAETPRYLIDTSLKLRQFGLFGIPAVCPHFATGEVAGRFGYRPGDPESIRTAIERALANREPIIDSSHNWSAIVDRILRPQDYPDTKL